MDNDYVDMGKRILIYPNDRVIYGNKEIDTNLFLNFIKGLISQGYRLTYYKALGGFLVSNPKKREFYCLELSTFENIMYDNGLYTPLTEELRKLILLQEKQSTNTVKVKK